MASRPDALTVPTNGINYRVWRWAADAPPLVVVHGITNSARGWDFVCRQLQGEPSGLRGGFDVYAVDLRGHGESDKPEHGYGAADYAADVAGVIRGLGLVSPVVVGHSLGARTSARLAADYPDLVSRLVLVDLAAGGRDPAQLKQAMDGFLQTVRASRERGAAAVREQYPHWTDEQVAARVEGHRLMSDRVMVEPVERPDTGTALDDLPRIACPTLFLYGDVAHKGPRPGVVPPELAERARGLLPDGEVVFVPGTGHMIPWDDLPAFMGVVRDFLARRAAPARPTSPR